MYTITINEKEFEVVIKQEILAKLACSNNSVQDLLEILEENKKLLYCADKNEDFMVEGKLNIVGYIEGSQIFISTLISKKNVY